MMRFYKKKVKRKIRITQANGLVDGRTNQKTRFVIMDTPTGNTSNATAPSRDLKAASPAHNKPRSIDGLRCFDVYKSERVYAIDPKKAPRRGGALFILI